MFFHKKIANTKSDLARSKRATEKGKHHPELDHTLGWFWLANTARPLAAVATREFNNIHLVTGFSTRRHAARRRLRSAALFTMPAQLEST